jgi:hypothetical protein
LTCSSSSLLNDVAFRPENIDWPFWSLTLTKTKEELIFLFSKNQFKLKPIAAGPWQTAETIFPRFQTCSANLIFALSSGKSKQGPWPPT